MFRRRNSMEYRFHNETEKIHQNLRETNHLIIIFTFNGSIARQDRSKQIDSPTIYHGTSTGLDLGVMI